MACEQLHIVWKHQFHVWQGTSDTGSTAEYRSISSSPIMSTTWYLSYIADYRGMNQNGTPHSKITLQLCRENYGKKLQIKGVLYYPCDSLSDIRTCKLDCIMDSNTKHVTFFEENRTSLPEYPTKLTCIAWITELAETEEKSVLTLPNFSKLLCDMHGVYEKQDYSDLIVICKGVEICVHKCVLSARSPVFAKMFEHGTTESSDNQIIISDIEPEIFKELMNFLYCGNINTSIYSRAHDLYYAAEKYFVTDLKDICRDLIISSLSSETVAQTLTLAERHNDKEMLDKVRTFLISSFQGVESTDAWKYFRKDKLITTRLISSVYEKFHSKNSDV